MKNILYILLPSLLLLPSWADAQSLICAQESITLSTSADADSYQWEVQEASLWENLNDAGAYSGTETSTLMINPVLAAMDGNNYRCLIPGILSEATDSVVYQTALTVLDTLEASIIAFEITPSSPLCYADNTVTLNQTTAPQGGNGVYQTFWEVYNGFAWEEVDGADPSQLVLTNQTQTQSYRQRTESAGVCGPVYSNELLVEVYELLNAPTIAITANDDGICYNTSPGELNMTAAPVGASGSYTYLWQELNGVSWDDLTGENETAYTPGTLTASQQYRLMVSDALCGSEASNSLSIEVFAPLSASMDISSSVSAPLCDNNSGATLQLDTPPQGGGNDFTYQWYQAGNALTGETSTVLNTGFLEDDANFELIATSNEGCGTVSSNPLTVAVYAALSSGSSSVDQTVCYDTAPEALNTTGASGASGVYTYQWQQNIDDSWTNIINAEATTYQPSNLTTTTQYLVIATDASGCGSVLSDPVEVVVLEEFVPGVVSASTIELCYEGEFNVSSSGGAGADGDITDTWYIQINDNGYSQDAGLDELSWTVNPATDDYDIFLESVSNFGCGTLYSDTLHVEVLDPIVSPAIDFPDYDGVPLCYGDLSPGFSATALAIGADGQWIYTWEQADTDGNWEDMQLGAGTYSPGTLLNSIQVRLRSISEFGCGTFYSNTLTVDVWEDVLPGTAGPGSEQVICYDTEAATLIAQPASGGGDTFTLQWYSDVDGAITGANSLIYNTGQLVDTTSYYLEYTNTNGCGVVNSNTMQISVLPELLPATVEGWDGITLCFNDPINLIGAGIIDYSWLDQQWHSAGTDGIYSTLSGFDQIELEDLSLQETTEFYIETTSVYGCGTVYSDTLMIPVWDILEAASIDFASVFDGSTLCFGDTSPLFTADVLASGGGGPLTYDWEIDEGTTGNFNPTGVTSAASFAPGVLTDTVAVRLRVVDDYGCGTLVSNVLDVNVYSPLDFEAQPETQLICFGNQPTGFFATPTGAGGLYSYQWYNSEDNLVFDGIEGQNNPTLENLSLEIDTWFYLELTSELGCGQVLSDTVTIQVLEQLQPGALSFVSNPICAEEFAEVISSLPSGGFEDFSYEWYQSESGDWNSVQEGGTTYNSDSLLFNNFFYAMYTDDCGTVYSDTVEITVNPLPVINPIIGAETACNSSTNQLYTIPWADPNLEYSWSIDPDFGVITSGETVDQVLIDWLDTVGATEIEVLVTNPTTSCNDLFTYAVEVSDIMAPPPSLVVKKPNINILVSADSTDCAQYLWGAQNIESGNINYIEDLTEQYAFFEELDTLNYYYFVEVVYDCGFGPSCPTINYYNYDMFIGIEEEMAQSIHCYPIPAKGHITIEGVGISGITFYSLQGKIVADRATNKWDLQHHIPLSNMASGMYILRARMDGGQTQQKHILIE